MPRYSTTTSIYTMLPGLPTSTANDSLIQQHADRAGGQIDAYVGRWYDVSGWTTSATTPQSVQMWSDAITAMLSMRSRFTQDAQNKNEWVSDLAEQAYKDLKMVADQELVIMDSTGTESGRAATAVLVEATREQYTPIFDIDRDLNWKEDPDLLDDISSDRS